MSEKQTQTNNPMHGITLENMVTNLAEYYGWTELGTLVRINCFNSDPSVKSSLKFLRKTHWARAKVEELYLEMLREKAADTNESPWPSRD